jgi:hypothetical protein
MGGLRRRSASQKSTENASRNTRIPRNQRDASFEARRRSTLATVSWSWTRVAIEMPLWSKGGVNVKRTRCSGRIGTPVAATSTSPLATAPMSPSMS